MRTVFGVMACRVAATSISHVSSSIGTSTILSLSISAALYIAAWAEPAQMTSGSEIPFSCSPHWR